MCIRVNLSFNLPYLHRSRSIRQLFFFFKSSVNFYPYLCSTLCNLVHIFIHCSLLTGSFIVFSHVKNKKIKDKFLFKKKHVSLAVGTLLKIRYHPNVPCQLQSSCCMDCCFRSCELNFSSQTALKLNLLDLKCLKWQPFLDNFHSWDINGLVVLVGHMILSS